MNICTNHHNSELLTHEKCTNIQDCNDHNDPKILAKYAEQLENEFNKIQENRPYSKDAASDLIKVASETFELLKHTPLVEECDGKFEFTSNVRLTPPHSYDGIHTWHLDDQNGSPVTNFRMTFEPTGQLPTPFFDNTDNNKLAYNVDFAPEDSYRVYFQIQDEHIIHPKRGQVALFDMARAWHAFPESSAISRVFMMMSHSCYKR